MISKKANTKSYIRLVGSRTPQLLCYYLKQEKKERAKPSIVGSIKHTHT